MGSTQRCNGSCDRLREGGRSWDRLRGVMVRVIDSGRVVDRGIHYPVVR